MRAAGFGLFLIGLFFAAGYAARVVPESAMQGTGPDGVITPGDRLSAWGDVAGPAFGGGLALMILGGVLARRAGAALETAPKDEATHVPLGDQLAAMEKLLLELPDGDPATHTDELRAALDDLLESKVPDFLERRTEMINLLSLGGYAGLMGAFAGMERAAGRCWSALTDEAWGEVPPTLKRARLGIRQSIELFEAVEAPAVESAKA
ncbi:MAG: hypothetical protein GXP55_19245 [Deltaproteobacteria bacterium]|nr:hypothetical protein [Deltaproteobacteria bacterium]